VNTWEDDKTSLALGLEALRLSDDGRLEALRLLRVLLLVMDVAKVAHVVRGAAAVRCWGIINCAPRTLLTHSSGRGRGRGCTPWRTESKSRRHLVWSLLCQRAKSSRRTQQGAVHVEEEAVGSNSGHGVDIVGV
jgi:hypothetical protein